VESDDISRVHATGSVVPPDAVPHLLTSTNAPHYRAPVQLRLGAYPRGLLACN